MAFQFPQLLTLLLDNRSLTREQVRQAFTELMQGRLTAAQTAALLTALRVKGETVDEITGAAEAMIAAALPVSFNAEAIVDTCGTGGDGQGSFNISTATAFVVAGAGFVVAKHGNRSISSRCGSADILEALDIPADVDARTVEYCLAKIGIAFLFAPLFHPAMKHAMPVRKELGVRTVFNLLGPLTNPVRPNVQLVGVYDPRWLQPVAKVLVQLGCRNGFVVHGEGHDEIVLSGPTQVAEIRDGRVKMQTWIPKNFGLTKREGPLSGGGTPAQNAKILLKVLKGEAGPLRDAVCMNAAAAILAATRQISGGGQGLELKHTFAIAQHSIDDGKALAKLDSLRAALKNAPKAVQSV
jgi:anthranilate phosphoribosyltransferase